MAAIGRRAYGLGAIALGVVELKFGGFSADWLPVPTHIAGYHILLYASVAVLILAGLAIQAPRVGAPAALVLAAFFASWMVAVLAPLTIAKPADWGGWQAIAESSVMALGGVLAYSQSRGVNEVRAARVSRIARWVFGACLLIFGGSHFVYAKFTAAMVPAWLPPSQLVWAYITGVAQIAAGLAMLSGVQARLAAILLTVMYMSFGLFVHLPSVITKPLSHDNWAENCINLLLTGAAWSLADSLSKKSRRS